MIVETDVLVRFAETDQMGIVHHATYLLYFEVGRVAFSKAVNASYNELEQAGFSLAVVEAKVRFAAPARFDQKLAIRTWIRKASSRAVTFAYEIVDGMTTQRVVTGHTRHICVDREGKVRRIPGKWYQAIKDNEYGE
ncbi:MAG: acyl-CoA thioesterase [Chloroflexi bacterium]|nr:acyl-CoA thioesterase [Chloroflexota bacterium]